MQRDSGLAERVCQQKEPLPLTEAELLPHLNATVDQLQEAEVLLKQHGLDPHHRPLVALNAGAIHTPSRMMTVGAFGSVSRDTENERSPRWSTARPPPI